MADSMIPHCFQPLIPGFEDNFSLPVSFQKYVVELEELKHGNEINIKLKDRRDKFWDVMIVSDQGGQIFKKGWKKFCDEHNVEMGDFLVFGYLGNLVFDVLILDNSTCERDLPRLVENKPAIPTPNTDVVDNLTVVFALPVRKGLEMQVRKYKPMEPSIPVECPIPIESPHFYTVVKKSNAQNGRLYVPSHFAREHGLANRTGNIKLIVEGGKSRSLPLRHDTGANNCTCTYTYIGQWSVFQRAFGINIGDSIIFELIDSTGGGEPAMKLTVCEQHLVIAASSPQKEVKALLN